MRRRPDEDAAIAHAMAYAEQLWRGVLAESPGAIDPNAAVPSPPAPDEERDPELAAEGLAALKDLRRLLANPRTSRRMRDAIELALWVGVRLGLAGYVDRIDIGHHRREQVKEWSFRGVTARKMARATETAALDRAVRDCRRDHPTWSRRAIAAHLLGAHGRPVTDAPSDRDRAIDALARKITRLRK